MKSRVREQMDLFTNGELHPVEDPPMHLPEIVPSEKDQLASDLE